MKHIIAVMFATSLCLLAGCASRGGDASSGGTANTANTANTGSGITVFGTIDAGVSGYKNQSR